MCDVSGNDIPEYRNITNENMYEFMIWANDKRSGAISVDHFNMIIQANINNWIQENNITWQFALTLVTDTINNQINIDSHFDISSNIGEDSVESGDNSYAATILRAQNADDYATIDTDSEEEYVIEDESEMEDNEVEEEEDNEEKIKPNSLEERRKLFAAAAEKRAKDKRF